MTDTPDRTGYTVTEQKPDEGQTTYAVLRTWDGVGLGAYASQERCDEIIAADRLHHPMPDQEQTSD